MMDAKKNTRDMLTDIGVGWVNATGIIPYMMLSPQATDPKAGQIVVLVQHIQRALWALGAHNVAVTGRLDDDTQSALTAVAGADWALKPWLDTVRAINIARARGYMISAVTQNYDAVTAPEAVGAFDFLPDVPGGLLTYAVGGFVLWRLMRGK